ncbi:MAG: helicase-related protein [Capnocytophaga felis]|nr:helicase-related protein [Capnocytophaga felis]
MANNFITNSGDKNLKNRIVNIIKGSDELKFLVGFFYFNGWQEIYETLQKFPQIKLKILVGLQVEKLLHQLVEHDIQKENLSQNEIVLEFFESNKKALNDKSQDTENFHNQVEFFLEMLIQGRLEIRKTKNPNHAKLYLFKYNDNIKEINNQNGTFITGSSNFTQAGLSGGNFGQDEFNVEIKDYGFEDAEQYFDELWESSIKITEIPERKQMLIDLIQHKTQVASVTPFEAYVLVLKTYLDLQQTKILKPETERILEEIGFKKFQYQLDAVNQALNIINEHNGVIIADVVGLGKSVIASLIGKNLGVRGMIICPPGLMGNPDEKTGWHGYIHDFQLYGWEVRSRGKLDKIAATIDKLNIEVIIVDEAHNFRNQDTADYELLSAICKDRKVVLLTATPFNNSPSDIYSLLNLFIVPGKSSLTLNDDLKQQFSAYNYEYKWISEIMKNHNSKDIQKKSKAEKLYQSLISEKLPINIEQVKERSKKLADKIKNILRGVTIRRNRLDLENDKVYSKEVGELSKMMPPKELFYYFTPEQSQFYNEVISHYFSEKGRFKGAIYQPFMYEKRIEDEEKLDMEGNRAFNQQKNLYDFMRRLLVKRFESSFGAFYKSVERFLQVHKVVRSFIEKSGGRFIMDRSLIEKMMSEDFLEEAIDDLLERYENDTLNKKTPKNNTVYQVKKFELSEEFISDIEEDIKVFEELLQKIKKFDLVENDPKRERIVEEIEQLRKQEPNKKIIVFSEYVDTVLHLKDYFKQKFKNRVLVSDGKINDDFEIFLNRDFNAQYNRGNQTNHFDILLTSDRLSEGYNLNRAGTIINYDIPWNPTRVIQRVGRINRMGQKVFDELSIFNFFPSEIGADIVKSREIAQQKMFLIHSSLGEDSKIFDIDEEPTPSSLYSKVNANIEGEELSFETEIRNTFEEIKEKYPSVIQKISELPNRIKTAKSHDKYQLNLLKKKGLGIFAQVFEDDEIVEIPFENFVANIQCDFEEEKRKLSLLFWTNYEAIKYFKPKFRNKITAESLENRALSNLQTYIGLPSDWVIDVNRKFAQKLVEDIKKYYSLPDRTLGRFARKKLSAKSKEEEIKAFDDEITSVRRLLGDNYLEKLLERVGNNENEVIIAIENQFVEF